LHAGGIGSLLAVAACELGRDDEALAALDGQSSTPVSFDLYWLLTTTNWATVAAHLGATAHAERLATALRPYAEQAIPLIGMPTPSVAHHLALLATTLARYDEAETWFAVATATHDRLGAPHWVARTRLEWAGMLATRRQPGDVDRASHECALALTTARQLGLDRVEQLAGALLQESS
jgi:hypothetical protein